VDGIGDFARRCGIDGGAIDEQALRTIWWGKGWVEDVMEDVLDV